MRLGHISDSIFGGGGVGWGRHKTLFLTNSSSFQKYWGGRGARASRPGPDLRSLVLCFDLSDNQNSTLNRIKKDDKLSNYYIKVWRSSLKL